MASELANFVLPKIFDNPAGWGPGHSVGTFEDPLFQPYNKTDRLSKISDWTIINRSKGRAGAVGSGFAFKNEEDDTNFSLAEKRFTYKSQFKKFASRSASAGAGPTGRLGAQGRGGGGVGARAGNNARANRLNAQNASQNGRGNTGGRGGGMGGRGGRGGRGGFRNNYFREEATRDPSVPIDASWQPVEEFTFDALLEGSVATVEAETLLSAGKLVRYNDTLDAILPKMAKGLPRASTEPYAASASADPYVKELAAKETADVYMTEAAMSLMMCAAKTAQPWDLLVRCTDGAVFVDYRPDSKVAQLVVAESSHDLLSTDADSLNHTDALAREATAIDRAFTQYAVSSTTAGPAVAAGASFAALAAQGPAAAQMSTEVLEQDRPAPHAADLAAGKQAAATVFRYRRFTLNPEGPESDPISVLVRSTLHAFKPAKPTDAADDAESEGPEEIVLKTLNEFDPRITGGMGWREGLETRPGAVLAGENKNNAARVARLAAEALMSGADTLKLGFLTRLAPKDAARHQVLKVETHDPAKFAGTMRLSAKSFWSAAMPLIQACVALPNGKYVMMRDPNRPAVRFYSVPDNTFDDEKCVVKSDTEAPSVLKK